MERRLDTDRLADLMASKHAVLESLRDLARRQPDLIGQGDMTRLLTLLSAKQTLLGELQRLERELDPFRSQDPDSRVWRDQEHRQRTRQTAERCESLLQEIMLLEKQSESDLVQRRDEAAARLDGAHSAAQARQAYLSAQPSQQTRLDISSDAR